MDSGHSLARPFGDCTTHLQRIGLAVNLIPRTDRRILLRSILRREAELFISRPAINNCASEQDKESNRKTNRF